VIQCAVKCVIQCVVKCVIQCAVKCVIQCVVKCVIQCVVKCVIQCAVKCGSDAAPGALGGVGFSMYVRSLSVYACSKVCNLCLVLYGQFYVCSKVTTCIVKYVNERCLTRL
jgi:hypothetical protein